MNARQEFYVSFVPLLVFVVLVLWICSYRVTGNIQLQADDEIIRHYIHSGLYPSEYTAQVMNNNFDDSLLLPGDMIFGHHPGGAYGYWTHCAIYLGNGLCSQQSLSEGMFVSRTYEFKYYYKQVKVFRVPMTDQQREQICAFVVSKTGSIFDMAAQKNDRRLWTCAKLCWAAFKEIGVDLFPQGQYVLPDFLIRSPQMCEIYHFQVEQVDNVITR